MREAGRVVHRAIHQAGRKAAPGVTTEELDAIAAEVIASAGGTSPFLGYAPNNHPPFPAWTCISVNDEVVHGIPGPRILMEGDIVTIDCGVNLGGLIADSAWTFPVGRIDPKAERLLQVTHDALFIGIKQIRRGARIGDIGWAVQRHAESNRMSVIRELTGHGVGFALHEGLQVPNYGKRGDGSSLQPGMTIAIEPMLSAGRREIETLGDEWTIVTADGSLAAHFEHTVAIGPNGPEILTNGE